MDSLIARAAKGSSGWRPSSPSRRIVDEVKSFADAALRIGYAEPEVDEYLRQGTKAFLAGEHKTARGVFEALLLPIADGEVYLGQHELVDEMLTVNVHDCAARYVVTVYVMAPLEDRADALGQAIDAVHGITSFWEPIGRMERIATGPLPEIEAFLPRWVKQIERESSSEGEWEGDRDRWLREAVQRLEGVTGLERLARKTKKPALRAWCAALVDRGEWAEALRAYAAAAGLVGKHWRGGFLGLPMGGAKGGSDFNPKGKSDSEVMRFYHSMMTELSRHIGEDVDIPAGDIGVGAREISYLFGQYKRVNNRFTGMITGKGLAFGSSLVRTEATGYGCVYFTNHMLENEGDSLEGSVSGSGNVALCTVEKALDLGAKVVTLSDSSGFIYDPAGIDAEKLTFLKELKEVRRGRISEYAGTFRCEFHEARSPWSLPCQVAFPCATQNEIDEQDAAMLITNGLIAVGEGANMPCTLEATRAFLNANVLLGPSKAANAGGVAVSGLEQSQNALRLSWSRAEVCKRLQQIMGNIHTKCCQFGDDGNGNVNYVRGANIAGFVKVANAMLAYGSV